MAVMLGGVAVTTLRVGLGGEAVTPKRVMLGTGSGAVEVWTDIVPFYAMGMSKATSQSFGARNQDHVTGFVARAGFPLSSIVNDCLVANSAATAKQVFFGLRAESSAGSRSFNLYQNDTSLGSISISSYGSSAYTSSVVVDIAPGDRFYLRADGGSVSKTIAGSSDTFIYWN